MITKKSTTSILVFLKVENEKFYNLKSFFKAGSHQFKFYLLLMENRNNSSLLKVLDEK